MRHNTDAHVLVPNVIATTSAEDCDRSDAFDRSRHRSEFDVRFGSKADMCSAKGHVRFTPESDVNRGNRNVRFVPIADIAALFDHLIGDRKQARWNCKPERFGGLEIDRQLELGG